jgi:long-chain-fatty-acid--CoA ligase ACSBG
MRGFYTASKYEYDPLTRYGGSADDAMLLIKALEDAATKNPDSLALAQPVQDLKGNLVKHARSRSGPSGTYQYRTWTWEQYYDTVMEAAAAFRSMGLKPMDAVNIKGVNSPEWVIAFLGCVAAGGLPVGLYPTDSPDALEFKAKDSGATFIVVGKSKDLDIYADFLHKPEFSSVKAVVHWDMNQLFPDEVSESTREVIVAGGKRQLLHWNRFLAKGQGEEAAGFRQQVLDDIPRQRPGQAATVVYTSGTTGNPKGVMLSQDALTWSCLQIMDGVMKESGDTCNDHVKGSASRITSPTSGVYGKDICKCPWPAFITGEEENCKTAGKVRKFDPWTYDGCHCSSESEEDAETPLSGPSEPHQRILSYLPLNHIAGQMLDIVFPVLFSARENQASTVYFPARCFLTRSCFTDQLVDAKPTLFLGVPAVWNGLKAKIEQAASGGLAKVALKYKPKVILNKLGLGSVMYAVSGAGPIPKTTLEFFEKAGIGIINMFGQSESSALGCSWKPTDFQQFDIKEKFGSLGRAIGNQLRIDKPNSEGQGEIQIRGRNVMLGYLNAFEKTKGAFTSDGWLATGDQARVDDDGFVFLTGRLKEIMKDIGGEMIAPVAVEEGIKKHCNKPGHTIVNHVVVVGDGSYFISALLTLTEVKRENIPTGKLEGAALKVDPAVSTVDGARASTVWRNTLSTCIAEYNKVAAKNQERVYRFAILPKDMTPDDAPNLMTPTMKIKRTGVNEEYADLIASCGADKALTSRSVQPC